MDDLGASLQAFLEQPGAMEQVSAMARQLGLGPADAAGEKSREAPAGMPQLQIPGVGLDPEAKALLRALEPLLQEGRREKIRRAERALQLTAMARAAMGALGK